MGCSIDMEKISHAKGIIKQYYLEDDRPWAIGFSGGKDSSLVVKLVLGAIKQIPEQSRKPIRILYCDTGVEIPIFRGYISTTLKNIEHECQSLGMDVCSKAVKPKLDNNYFVKVIGRGYPPPTNKFRLCTDKLRIDPIQVALREMSGGGDSLIALGTRYDESKERDKILSKYSTDKPLIFNQAGHSKTKLFCPIANFSVEDVWNGLVELNFPEAVDIHQISDMYKKVSGECPIIRLPDKNPCSKGRFGCWTCTVVRKDKATQNLIKNGYVSLQPLLDFRNWILKIRDNLEYRCNVRRNGIKGLGPFRLSAREKILKKLLDAQKESGFKLINGIEIARIQELWELDVKSHNYVEEWKGEHLTRKCSRRANAHG